MPPLIIATDYRIYSVEGGHIRAPAEIIQCDCDETAIAKRPLNSATGTT
jgi:hypothetical protein